MSNGCTMIFKVVLVGDSYTGKTNLFLKYTKNEFISDSKSTIGVEFGSKTIKIEGKSINFQIWDTAGQERYRALSKLYFKGSQGAIIVYDIAKRKTFENVDKWYNDLLEFCQDLNVVIVGNKSDLSEREVSFEEGKEKALKYKAAFLETSAKTGENVENLFELISNEIYERVHEEFEGKALVNIDKGIKINVKEEKKEKCFCLKIFS